MKIITIDDCKQKDEYDFSGLSTDEKPTNCAVNSLFLELDTGDFYYFNGALWKKIGERVTLGASSNTETIDITENDVYDVYDYDYANVNVPGVIPVGTLPIFDNGTEDVTNYASAKVDVDYATVNFNLPAFTSSTPTALSKARSKLAATTVGGYALFGGGYTGSSSSNVVNAYDTSLTRTTPTGLSKARDSLAATTVGGYALFGGGGYSTVDAYDTSLTRTTPTALSQARFDFAATTIGNYALFGGGNASYYLSAVVDAYDTSLTRTTPTGLNQARSNLAATTVAPAGGSSPQSGYALFGGGDTGSYNNPCTDVVDAYDTSLTRTTPTGLSQVRRHLAATTVGGYALFGGGYTGSSLSNVVDAYDTSLTRTTPTELSEARNYFAATTVAPAGGSSPQSGYALFGGGYTGSRSAVVDAYDTSLTRTAPTELSEARDFLAATTVAPAGGSSPQSGYALFGGGDGGSRSAVVDAYSLASYNIQVFPETRYNFNNSGEIFSDTMQTISIQGPAVGYIKIKNVNVN